MPLSTRMKWEYCSLIGRKIVFLGAEKLFDNKSDGYSSEAHAWDYLEKEGWELTAVAPNKHGELVHYFKRRLEE